MQKHTCLQISKDC